MHRHWLLIGLDCIESSLYEKPIHIIQMDRDAIPVSSPPGCLTNIELTHSICIEIRVQRTNWQRETRQHKPLMVDT